MAISNKTNKPQDIGIESLHKIIIRLTDLSTTQVEARAQEQANESPTTMTAFQSVYREPGDEMESAPGHVHFAPGVSVIPIFANEDTDLVSCVISVAPQDDQDNSCPGTCITRPSPSRHDRPQLKRSDALEPDFMEPSHNCSMGKWSTDVPAAGGKCIRRHMLKRSDAFESY